MNEKRYKVNSFDYCLLLIKRFEHGIAFAEEYQNLNKKDKRLIDALIESNQLS